MKNRLLLFIILGICFLGNAQNMIVKGKVINKERTLISDVSIVIYVNKTIEGYTFSNNKGMYSIQLNALKNNDSLKISINGLGYKGALKNILYTGQQELIQDFVLEDKAEVLDEVVLEAWEKIKVSIDTLTFKASKFMNGTEQVVEDLLKNLPGVEVLKDGSIKVNGKSIDKLLIEGDDLFDDKYKLLSKNLDAKNISEVQILNNFEDNPVLKSFQESEKVALNLKLKEEKKNVWFGNVNVGLGTNSRHTGTSNLGLLKKKIKFFNLTSLNNISGLAIPQVKNSGSINISDLQTEKKIEKDNNPIVNIDNLSNSNFSNNEDIFNDSFLNSLSYVTSLSENTKLRSLSFYAFDKVAKQNSNLVRYFTLPEAIMFSEERNIAVKDVIFASEIELKHYNKNKTYFTYNFSFENNSTLKNGSFLSNQNSIHQDQDDKKHNFFNHLNITKKLSENNLLTIYAYYGLNNTKQNFIVKPNIFDQDFNEEASQSFIKQNSNSPLNYTGLITELISKLRKSEFGLELLGSFDYDKINSVITAGNHLIIDSLSNNTNYKKTTLSATGKYNLDITDELKLKSSINISQNYTNLDNDKETILFINPKIGLTYKRKRSGVLGLNYSFVNNLPSITFLNKNYIMNNYRTFSRGLEHILPTKNHNINFTYTYKNYKKLFLINSSVLYSFSDLNYGTENSINETFSFNTYRILNGGDYFSFDIGITKSLNNLPISIKLNTQQSWTNSFLIVNSTYGKVKNHNSTYRLQGTTYFNIPLNFKFHLQYNYSNGKLNNQKTSNGYLETSLNSILELSKKWILEINNDYYSINSNNFLFTNMKVNYNPEKSRWSYMIIANNLSNINEFSNNYISEYQQTSSSFKITPRYIILHLKFRF